MRFAKSCSEIFDPTYAEAVRGIHETGLEKHGRSGYERVVFTNGCFDVLHSGHLNVLAFAAILAGPRGAVVVGLNTDKGVMRLKGNDRPVFSLQNRMRVLQAIRYVDHVIPFDEETPADLIERLRPNSIVKGGDYDLSEVVGRHVCQVYLAPYLEGHSTTETIRRIRGTL
jgi:D-beta-D-heptose 7-phosphate kinase / D-beta-D-heptose 1-phosphate adenosyltransferase